MSEAGPARRRPFIKKGGAGGILLLFAEAPRTQYLLELGVGSVPHKLQNERFAGGEESPALPHAGQCHQPVHLAAGQRERGEGQESVLWCA